MFERSEGGLKTSRFPLFVFRLLSITADSGAGPYGSAAIELDMAAVSTHAALVVPDAAWLYVERFQDCPMTNKNPGKRLGWTKAFHLGCV